MEEVGSSAFLLVAAYFLVTASATAAVGYTNHTVGGDAGWFFDTATNKSSADYTSWANNQTFNLGDFLIFNTNTNQTVFQTFNSTTYESCSTDDSSDTTFQYDGGVDILGEAITIAVPLTLRGPQYYFSDANDGLQCFQGMAFEINVNPGLGLPPSLNQPPPPPYAPPPVDDGDSPPIPMTGTPGSGGMKSSPSFQLLFLVLSPILLTAQLY